MRELHLDIETFSPTDISVGVYRYCQDPDFQILMVAYTLDDEPVRVTTDWREVEAYLRDPSIIKIAHNAQFERICFSTVLGLPVGEYLSPVEWHDTMASAAEYGWPQKLDFLAKALRCSPKDTAGTRLINLFSKPNRHGERTLPEDRPEDWKLFLKYCCQDVETLREVHRKLGYMPTATERATYVVDQLVNDRGLRIDVPMARLAAAAAEHNQLKNELEVMAATGIRNPNSTQQMLAWLESSGLALGNLREATVTKALEEDLEPLQRQVLELRQELALTAANKFSAALDAVGEDGRLRGTLRFFGAHTGRWSGRGVQPQNLPRASLESEVAVEAAILDLRLGDIPDSATLKALVRPLFLGPMTVVDYSAIEARVVAWLAGEEWALQAFRDGRDIYVETAERMGGLTRSQGKVAVLALGYNGAVNSLRAMAGSREALLSIAKPPGVPVGDQNTLNKMVGEVVGMRRLDTEDMSDSEIDNRLAFLVRQWRQANPKIVNLWAELGDAFADGGSVGAGLLTVHAEGKTRILELPSGRGIHYHNVSWDRYIVETEEGRKLKGSWRFDNPRGGGKIGTYGGRLTENATQAVARDVLAEALVRLEEKGYRTVGHVHDEILVEGEHPVDEISRIMTESPEWAAGLPLGGAGFTCKRYRKD